MVNFRITKKEDVPATIKLMEEFRDESLGEYGITISSEYILATAEKYLDSSFVAEKDGVIIGVLVLSVQVLPMSGEKVAQELIWYMNKNFRKYGIKLLTFAENWCIAQGMKKLIMMCMANLHSEQLSKFYARCGFVPLEFQYIKQLGEA